MPGLLLFDFSLLFSMIYFFTHSKSLQKYFLKSKNWSVPLCQSVTKESRICDIWNTVWHRHPAVAAGKVFHLRFLFFLFLFCVLCFRKFPLFPIFRLSRRGNTSSIAPLFPGEYQEGIFKAFHTFSSKGGETFRSVWSSGVKAEILASSRYRKKSARDFILSRGWSIDKTRWNFRR